MALGIGFEAEAGFGDSAAFADTGHHILQRAALGRVIEHVVGRDQLHGRRIGELPQPRDALAIVAAIKMAGGESDRAGETALHFPKLRRESFVGRVGRDGDEALAFAIREQLGEAQVTFAFLCAPLAVGQKLRQPAIGGAVGRIDQHARRIEKVEPRPDDEAHAHILALGLDMRAHHPGQGVAIGQRDRRQPQGVGGHHQLARMRCPAQEAVIAHRLQLGIGVSH